MHLAYSLLAVFCLLAQSGIARSTDRIVGGVPAEEGEFPFMVSLQRGTSHFCGGSLVDKSWVLTAAHCVKTGTSGIKIRIGVLKLGTTDGVETFTAKKIISHPDNSSSTNAYDFALIQLSGESAFTPVALNADALDLPELETDSPMAVTVGWGRTAEGGSISSKLLKVEVPLVNTARCEAAYPGEITDSMLCAGFEKGGKDSCQGDSGGPLLIENESGEKVLAGVVSWGEGCARPKKYGVYGAVPSALEWLTSQLATQ